MYIYMFYEFQNQIYHSYVEFNFFSKGGALLLELNRMLRPGGYFVWSATPVYQNLEEDVQIWKGIYKVMFSPLH